MKIKRSPIYPAPYRKESLAEEEIELSLGGEAVVEEKMDSRQFRADYGDRVVSYEYMGVKHQTLHTKLSSYHIAFDVYETKSRIFLGILGISENTMS